MQLPVTALTTVEDGLALFDFPVFQQQCAQFAGSDLMLDTAGQVAQPGFLFIPVPGRKVALYPLSQIDAFSHIEQFILLAKKAVDAGEAGQVGEQGWVHRGRIGIWQHGPSIHGKRHDVVKAGWMI